MSVADESVARADVPAHAGIGVGEQVMSHGAVRESAGMVAPVDALALAMSMGAFGASELTVLITA
jgi:hypothetical protein